jgi:hypothetical protein
LTKNASSRFYNTIPSPREWLITNYVINIKIGILPKFYIFRGKNIKGLRVHKLKDKCRQDKTHWLGKYGF